MSGRLVVDRLVLEGFLPFRGRVELPMAEQGLVMLRGRNMVSAAADSNGVGKTSVIHGLAYNWHGEDLAGRKADAVCNRFSEGTCYTRTDMHDALGPWSVERTRRPAGLVVTGVPGVRPEDDMAVVQVKVLERLGHGLRTFRNAIVFGQGNFDRYAHAEQGEQLRMLDEIQGVDFRAPLTRADVWRRDLQGQLQAESEAAVRQAAQATEAATTASALTLARDGFEAARRVRLAAVEGRRPAAALQLERALEDQALAEQDAAALAALRSAVAEDERLAADLVAHRRDADSWGGEATRREQDRDALKASVKGLVSNDECPTCLGPVKRSKAAVERRFAKRVEALEVAAKAARGVSADADGALRLADAARLRSAASLALLVPEQHRARPAGYLAVLEQRCAPAASAQRAAAVVAARLAAGKVDEDLAAERATRWDGADALASAEGRGASASAQSQRHRVRAGKIQVMCALADYCHEAFGDRGVRSMLVDGVADFVNEKVAEHLELLAGGEATLRMSAQTGLKKGGAKERISFTPEWSWGGSGTGTGSGGQDRRIDLALFSAIQDLAESRSARAFPFKVYDEPFDALDARGKELACGWVKRQAAARGTAILVTHSEEIAAVADPDHTWTIIMERGGARVEID